MVALGKGKKIICPFRVAKIEFYCNIFFDTYMIGNFCSPVGLFSLSLVSVLRLNLVVFLPDLFVPPIRRS